GNAAAPGPAGGPGHFRGVQAGPGRATAPYRGLRAAPRSAATAAPAAGLPRPAGGRRGWRGAGAGMLSAALLRPWRRPAAAGQPGAGPAPQPCAGAAAGAAGGPELEALVEQRGY